MGNPPPSQAQPNQIQHYPHGGELQHLFTKTLSQDDMLGLFLTGDSYACLRSLPNPLLNEIARTGLEIEIYTPNRTSWVSIYYERASRSFRLQKIDWLDVVIKSGFSVGDRIACWSLYHAHVGPNGILSLLIEKVPNKNEGGGQPDGGENGGQEGGGQPSGA